MRNSSRARAEYELIIAAGLGLIKNRSPRLLFTRLPAQGDRQRRSRRPPGGLGGSPGGLGGPPWGPRRPPVAPEGPPGASEPHPGASEAPWGPRRSPRGPQRPPCPPSRLYWWLRELTGGGDFGLEKLWGWSPDIYR